MHTISPDNLTAEANCLFISCQNLAHAPLDWESAQKSRDLLLEIIQLLMQDRFYSFYTREIECIKKQIQAIDLTQKNSIFDSEELSKAKRIYTFFTHTFPDVCYEKSQMQRIIYSLNESIFKEF